MFKFILTCIQVLILFICTNSYAGTYDEIIEGIDASCYQVGENTKSIHLIILSKYAKNSDKIVSVNIVSAFNKFESDSRHLQTILFTVGQYYTGMNIVGDNERTSIKILYLLQMTYIEENAIPQCRNIRESMRILSDCPDKEIADLATRNLKIVDTAIKHFNESLQYYNEQKNKN